MVSNENLIEWAGKQHYWLSDAIKTFYEKGKFEVKDVERFAETCLLEQAGKGKRIDLTGLNLLEHGQQGSLTICGISNVEGVNALKAGQSLNFSPKGITVVYGDNGAGKSGYIRIVKQISNAKYKEEIRGNVYRRSEGPKKCNITIDNNGKEEILVCDLNKAGEYDALRNIDIFDTKISRAYVETAKEASYEPWIFSMLSAVANVTTNIKDKLEEKKSFKQIEEIKIPEGLADEPQLSILKDYTSSTIIDESEYKWEDSDEEALQKLKKQSNIDTLTAEIKQLSGCISSIETLIIELEKYKAFYSKDNVEQITKYKEEWSAAIEKKNAAMLLFQSQASEVDKDSVNNSAWISLWHSAKTYYEEILSAKEEIKYNVNGGRCPFCRQKIQMQSLQRIQSIEEYINGRTSNEEAKCRELYEAMFCELVPCWSEEVTAKNLNTCDIQDLREEIEKTLNMIRTDYDLVSQKKFDEVKISSIDIVGIIRKLREIKSARENEKSNKNTLLKDEEHVAIQKKIKELSAKKFMGSIISVLTSNIDVMRYYKEIDKAESFSNSKAITKKSNQLANELLSEDYIKRFNDELKKLTKGAVHVTLKQQRGGKGKVPFRVELLDTKGERVSPAEVLSEGENRVVSLAAFFAEASGRNEKCPLIVDDPISSLDYTYEEAVISRLVDAAKYRQVIVFTHRISMAVGIDENANKKGVDYTELRISGRGAEKGVPIPSSDYAGNVLKRVNNLLNTNIAQIKNLDINNPVYDERVHYVCQQMRIIVEKSVEDVLLNEVVKRFRRDIKTKGMIEKLADISQEDCRLIDEMMTKYSYYEHSMSDETPLMEFSIEDIESDATRIRDWIKQKKAKKAL